MSRPRLTRDLILNVFQNSAILEFCDFKDIARLRRACRLFWPFLANIQSAIIQNGIFKLNYSWVASMTSLHRIHLSQVYFNEDDLYTLRHCHLTELRLHCADTPDVLRNKQWDSCYGLLAIAENSPDMNSFSILNEEYQLGKKNGAKLLRMWRHLASLIIKCDCVDVSFIDELFLCEHLTTLSLIIHYGSIDDDPVHLNPAVQAYVEASHENLIDLNLTIKAYNEYTGPESDYDMFGKFEYTAYSWGKYPSLTKLTVNDQFRITDETLEILVRNTPMLKEFWYGNSSPVSDENDIDYNGFTSFEKFGSWKYLESIYIEPLEDDDHAPGIDAVFKNCLQLSAVRIDPSIYQPDLPDLVATHCFNLSLLDCRIVHGITTKCLEDLLANCPKLKQLRMNSELLCDASFIILNKMNLAVLFIESDRNGGPALVSTESFMTFAISFGSRIYIDKKTRTFFELSVLELSLHNINFEPDNDNIDESVLTSALKHLVETLKPIHDPSALVEILQPIHDPHQENWPDSDENWTDSDENWPDSD